MTAAVGLGVPTPAQAASCSGSHGVTVVVDFHQLGGGVHAACDAGGGGKTALTQLTDVGHQLAFVQRQPGFVCRIDGSPANDPCVNTPPADAYWSVWWSDGTSGTWIYSSSGAASLQVPDGGYVGLSWQGGDGKAPPGVAPAAHPSAPPPSSSPTHPPSSSPTRHASSSPTSQPPSRSPTASSSGSPTPSRPPSATHDPAGPRPTQRPSPTPSAAPPDVPVGAAEAADAPDTSAPGSGSGLPGWVAPVLVGALFVSAGVVALVRRRRAGGR